MAFLNDFNEEEIRKNPFKAFAAFTALKFEDLDEKCSVANSLVSKNKEDIFSLQEKKLDKEKWNEFLRDYDVFKTTMKVYVVIGTVVINVVFLLLASLLHIKI